MPDLSDELAKIDQALVAQESLRAVLPADQIELILAALRDKRAALLALNTGSGAIAQGDHPQAAGVGGVNVGGNVYGNIYTGPPPKDKAEQRRIYLDVLAAQVNQLPLRAFDAGQSNPKAKAQALSLVNVYTALNTTEQVSRPISRARNAKPIFWNAARPVPGARWKPLPVSAGWCCWASRAAARPPSCIISSTASRATRWKVQKRG